VLVIAVGIAVGAARVFGVSVELGAFLAGVAVGRSEFAARAAADAVPMRDAFSVLFFVSVGMLFTPRSIVDAPLVLLAVLAVVIVGKPLGHPCDREGPRHAPGNGDPRRRGLFPGGRIQLHPGGLAQNLGLLNGAGWNALVAASMISIALNPSIYRWARRFSPRSANLAPVPAGRRPQIDPNCCILVGYGPVGKIVDRLLAERGRTPR